MFTVIRLELDSVELNFLFRLALFVNFGHIVDDGSGFPHVVIWGDAVKRDLVIDEPFLFLNGPGGLGEIVDFDLELLEILHGDHLDVVQREELDPVGRDVVDEKDLGLQVVEGADPVVDAKTQMFIQQVHRYFGELLSQRLVNVQLQLLLNESIIGTSHVRHLFQQNVEFFLVEL